MKRFVKFIWLIGFAVLRLYDPDDNRAVADTYPPTGHQARLLATPVPTSECNAGSGVNRLLAQAATPLIPTMREAEAGRPFLASGRQAVAIEEIQATRSSFFSYLDIKLQVSGVELENAASFRCRVTKAIDDTEANLIRADDNPPGFDMFGPIAWIRLELPVRKATVLSELSGVVESLNIGRDPQATVSVTGFVGKPLVQVSHPSLAANGVALSIVSAAEFEKLRGEEHEAMQEHPIERDARRAVTSLTSALGKTQGLNDHDNRLVVFQDDPKHRIVSIEFFIRTGGSIPVIFSESGVLLQKGVRRNYSAYNFSERLPETAVVRITLATPKAVAVVPFSLKDVPLP